MAFNDPPLPNPPRPGGPFFWRHSEPDPIVIGPAALATARFGAWESLDPETRARHLRALVVMSLQAATMRSEAQTLGVLSAASFSDDEHNAAGAAVARTLMVIAPRGPALVAQNIQTTGGKPAVAESIETGLAPLFVAVAIVAAAAVAGAVAYVLGRDSAETTDRAEFRAEKTKQLISTQARALDVIAKHIERERIAGKPLPFTDEEKALLRSLEDAQRAIVTERREPLPSPFDGAKVFENLLHETKGALDALLPVVLVGGALYLISRYGGEAAPAAAPPPPRSLSSPPHPGVITLTRNKDGWYEHQEDDGES